MPGFLEAVVRSGGRGSKPGCSFANPERREGQAVT